MKFIALTCENCGGGLSVKEGVKYVTCGNCNTQFQILNEQDTMYLETLKVNVVVEEKISEEARLHIREIREREVSKPPFDWRPGILDFILTNNELGRGWKIVSDIVIEVEKYNIEGEKAIIFTSRQFPSYIINEFDLSFPSYLINKINHTKQGWNWLMDFYNERRLAWEETNKFLRQNGWVGITKTAIKRTPPFHLSSTFTDKSQVKTLHDDSWNYGYLRIADEKRKLKNLLSDFVYKLVEQ